MRNILLTLLLAQTFFHGLAQDISREDYLTPFIEENFDKSESLYFKSETNQKNYINTDNNTLFLIRKNSDTPYLVFAKHKPLEDFIIQTELRIGPSVNKEASVGLILKAKKDGSSGIIFEINRKGEYRITQKDLNIKKNLSGKNHSGWVKSKILNSLDKPNSLEIRSEKNIYDIYINHKFITSFKSLTPKSGITGIFINHSTKARVSHFHIRTKKSNTSIIYSDTIVNQLNQRIKKLRKENTHLKSTIATFSNRANRVQRNNSEEMKKDIKETKENELLEANASKKDKHSADKSHAEIKELMIRKSFEKNGIIPSEIIKRTSQQKQLKPDPLYTVQLGVYMKKNQKVKSSNLWCKKTDLGTYIYFSGKFKTVHEAVLHLNHLVLKGYKNAFVIMLNK